jgi:hypothetical protein
LEKTNCKWLLVFDNVSSSKSIKFPKTNAKGKHVIITTREKQIIGDNVLMVTPFTDQESMRFLSKIHLKEEKKDIIKLHKILYNYPLALAQVSDEILIHRCGIKGYFEKPDVVKVINTASMNPIIIQEYTNSYHEVLNNTVQEFELSYKKAAKILYILALLKTNITKKLFNELFGGELDNELIVLNKYGIIQMTPYEKTFLLNIHDVIREQVIKRFNDKEIKYKKTIISFICKHFNVFYSENNFRYLNSLGPTSKQVMPLYAFLEEVLQDEFVDENMVNILIIALRLNDILYSRYANDMQYQKLASKVYSKKLDNISVLTKASLYASLIYLNMIYESKENLLKFESDFFRLIKLIEDSKDPNRLFFIYTYIFKFYVMLGNLDTAEKFLKIAETKLNDTSNIFSLLQYWYTKMWLYYDSRRMADGMKAFDVYEKLVNQLPIMEMQRSSLRNFRIMFGVFSDQKNKTKKEIQEALKSAAIYYSNTTSSTIGDLEFVNGLLCFQNNQYDLAFMHVIRSLDVLNKDPGDMRSGNHGDLYFILGKIYERRGNFTLALKNYEKCLRFYYRHSYGRNLDVYGYGELLATLSTFYYKQKDYNKSKFYFRKLILNFGLDHKIVEELIKTLPSKYMCLVNSENG